MTTPSPTQTVDSAALRMHPVCRRITAAVRAVEPDAEVWLFGSRARGDAREDSDWDVLVLLAGIVDGPRRKRISDSVYDRVTAPAFTDIVSVLIREREPWRRRAALVGLPAVVAVQGIQL